jgi:hypothetical protein
MNKISLYAIVRDADRKYFAGFDPEQKTPILVDDVLHAKLFTNKFDIRLRPDEKMVEVVVIINEQNTQVTPPFRPRRKSDNVVMHNGNLTMSPSNNNYNDGNTRRRHTD